MSKINTLSLSGEYIFTCEDKLLLCHFQILNKLYQENKISIKKIFLMLIRGVSVPNTHYSVKYSGMLVLLWSQHPSFWSTAKGHSLTPHISWDRKKMNETTLELNSHLTSPISLSVWLWCLQGSYSSFILICTTPSAASTQTDGIFLA